jgi:hypothetical protein
MFWVISVNINIRNTLPKSGTFLLGHSVYILPSNNLRKNRRTGRQNAMSDILIFNIITRSAGRREAGKYIVLKFHRQSPLLLLVKVGWKGGRTMRSRERACWVGAAEEMIWGVWTVWRKINLNYFLVLPTRTAL